MSLAAGIWQVTLLSSYKHSLQMLRTVSPEGNTLQNGNNRNDSNRSSWSRIHLPSPLAQKITEHFKPKDTLKTSWRNWYLIDSITPWHAMIKDRHHVSGKNLYHLFQGKATSVNTIQTQFNCILVYQSVHSKESFSSLGYMPLLSVTCYYVWPIFTTEVLNWVLKQKWRSFEYITWIGLK